MSLYDEILRVKSELASDKWTPVSQGFVDHFLGAVPPIYFKGGFACGEAYDDTELGVRYFCLVDNFCRICTIADAVRFAGSLHRLWVVGREENE